MGNMTNINLNDKIGDSGKLEKSEAEPNDFKDSGEKEIKKECCLKVV